MQGDALLRQRVELLRSVLSAVEPWQSRAMRIHSLRLASLRFDPITRSVLGLVMTLGVVACGDDGGGMDDEPMDEMAGAHAGSVAAAAGSGSSPKAGSGSMNAGRAGSSMAGEGAGSAGHGEAGEDGTGAMDGGV